MIFNASFNYIVDFLMKFNPEFACEFAKMQKSLPKAMLKACEACRDINFEDADSVGYLAVMSISRENDNIELSYDNNISNAHYLFNICSYDFQDLNDMRLKKSVDSNVGFPDELASLIIKSEEGYSICEYIFEIFKLIDGFHIVLSKYIDDGSYRHGLIEAFRHESSVDPIEFVPYPDPRQLIN